MTRHSPGDDPGERERPPPRRGPGPRPIPEDHPTERGRPASERRRPAGPAPGRAPDGPLTAGTTVDPDAGEAGQRRRLAAIVSGFEGDEAGARVLLGDGSPRVRSSALVALARMARLAPGDAELALCDRSPLVRRALCELVPPQATVDLTVLLDDQDPGVVEACAFALGELGARHGVDRLAEVASGHPDPLCREAAVAALGSIGDRRGYETLLGALDDVAPIRRRAVIALSSFEGEEVDRALRARLRDRDWQVRQAVEDLLDLSGREEP